MPALAVMAAFFLEPPGPLQAQGGGRGQQAPVAPRAGAAIDLAGYWVSVVTEDWRFRMVVPPKGNYGGVPLTAEGRRVADAWDAAKDRAAGEQCKAYGAAGLMRLPGRLRIDWETDNTLRIDADAGTQTRVFHFGSSRPASGAAAWQGQSIAQWEYAPAARGRPRTGNLKVVTTGMRSGYLRRNGVPYSSKCRPHRALRPHHGARRQQMAGRADRGRRSAVSHPAVRDDHALQARARRIQVESDAVRRRL